MGMLSDLNREQKASIGLLSIGTFLEYFDLMLYVHMAVLLNELFFPQSDQYSASLLGAFAFSSTFIFRPIGALVFGWLGDHVGRKSTIILTTMIMCFSCIVMANAPTYAQVGIASAWIITICRVAQGISTMGEAIGAQIYITESIRPPASYPAVGFLSIACGLGSLGALGIASFVTSFSFNWRYAFWGGAVIAFVGAAARVYLREAPEFLEMKRRKVKGCVSELNSSLEQDDAEAFLEILRETPPDQQLNCVMKFQQQTKDFLKETTVHWSGGTQFKTFFSYFFIHCGWPITFYLAFIYFNSLLKGTFGYSADDVIRHNLYLSIILLVSNTLWVFLSYRIYPLKLLKTRGASTLLLMILLPFIIQNLTSSSQLFLIQSLLLLFLLGDVPSATILLNRLPMFRRFTFASLLFASSQALMNIITSFGLVYLGSYFGSYGLWLITIPVAISFLCAVFHFEGLDREHERELQQEREEDEQDELEREYQEKDGTLDGAAA